MHEPPRNADRPDRRGARPAAVRGLRPLGRAGGRRPGRGHVVTALGSVHPARSRSRDGHGRLVPGGYARGRAHAAIADRSDPSASPLPSHMIAEIRARSGAANVVTQPRTVELRHAENALTTERAVGPTNPVGRPASSGHHQVAGGALGALPAGSRVPRAELERVRHSHHGRAARDRSRGHDSGGRAATAWCLTSGSIPEHAKTPPSHAWRLTGRARVAIAWRSRVARYPLDLHSETHAPLRVEVVLTLALLAGASWGTAGQGPRWSR